MKTIYQCDFCPGTSSDAGEIVIHELNCLFNPANRGCLRGRNYIEGDCKKKIETKGFETDCDGWEEREYE